MRNVLPPYNLAIEPLILIRLRSPFRRNSVTHPFDLLQIWPRLGPECLDTHLAPIKLDSLDIRESPRIGVF